MPESEAGGSNRGLYEKYHVEKDGQEVEDCFVLEPQSDRAAREVIGAYADATHNVELASDLRKWVRRFADTDGEQ